MKSFEFITEAKVVTKAKPMVKQMPTGEELPIEPSEIAPVIRRYFNAAFPKAALNPKTKLKMRADFDTLSITAGRLVLYIGGTIGEDGNGVIMVSGGGGMVSAGKFKGAVTGIVDTVNKYMIRKYGQPVSGKNTLVIDYDKGDGVWQHIGQKIGMNVEARD